MPNHPQSFKKNARKGCNRPLGLFQQTLDYLLQKSYLLSMRVGEDEHWNNLLKKVVNFTLKRNHATNCTRRKYDGF
jgi:hypothetical protein